MISPSIPAGRRKIEAERRYAAGIHESMMASIENSSAISGRARLMDEPANGLRKVPIVTMISIMPRELLFARGGVRSAPARKSGIIG
jgi:hypothetical protein